MRTEKVDFFLSLDCRRLVNVIIERIKDAPKTVDELKEEVTPILLREFFVE